MAESLMLEKSKDFAVDIVFLCKNIKTHYNESILTNQLIRCATSIGANIHEANYGQSRADFISKLQISLKECYESEYWLELLCRVNYINEETYKDFRQKCGVIRRMLISSINTAKKNS